KCRRWWPREDLELDDDTIKVHGFGNHDTSSDGLQSICFKCKGVMNKKAREKNVGARIRHHTATRCLTQLAELAPQGFTENLEEHLGYTIRALTKALRVDLKKREGPKRKLRDALNEGYHIDHIRPLSSFPVVYQDKNAIKHVDWDVFRECWAMSNLSAIPASENLEKGASYVSEHVEAHSVVIDNDTTPGTAGETQAQETTKEEKVTPDADNGP
ncbi:MAG: hypothetical protein V3S69_01380, partial [Dehalococcoidales bacterium]